MFREILNKITPSTSLLRQIKGWEISKKEEYTNAKLVYETNGNFNDIFVTALMMLPVKFQLFSSKTGDKRYFMLLDNQANKTYFGSDAYSLSGIVDNDNIIKEFDYIIEDLEELDCIAEDLEEDENEY